MPNPILKYAAALFDGVVDITSPPVCVLCGRETLRRRRALCWDCLRARLITNERPLCAVCGRPAVGEVTGRFTCGDCERERPAFDRARAATSYAGEMRGLVQKFKYNAGLWLAGDFADLLQACFLAHYADRQFDMVVPVPISFLKKFKRHYNQSEFLARGLAEHAGLPFFPHVLGRRFVSASQTRLSRGQRMDNARHAFAVRQPGKVADRDILLVDDVFTTGATANACARELRRVGAASVCVITVARGELSLS